MTDWQRGYCDGAEAAARGDYRVAPRGHSNDWQIGWRAGFDDECVFRGWVTVETVGDFVVTKYGRNVRI